MYQVKLTANEIHLAASHAILRRYEKLAGKRGDRIQKEQSTWDNEIEGACAELAWCKLQKKYWSGVSDIRAKDGGDVEIRWTKWNAGGLIIYPHDKDDSIFVLSRGFAPNFEFVGWLTAGDGKKLGKMTSFGFLVPEDKISRFE
jgi:hypothetical protein